MLENLERQKKFTINQWKIFAAATIGDMLDFFDFLLIAFILAFIVKDWHLTYGQSAAILLSSGVSAPLGSAAIRSLALTWPRSGRLGCAPAAWGWPMAPAISASSSARPGSRSSPAPPTS